MGDQQQQEKVVYGIYHEAEDQVIGNYTTDEEDSGDEGDIILGPDGQPMVRAARKRDAMSQRKKKLYRKKRKNLIPMSSAAPRNKADYVKEHPMGSTVVALLSNRRMDQITAEQTEAARNDTCLPCGQSKASDRNLLLYQISCKHKWCAECLARVFKFALKNHTFNKFQCCGKEEIPLDIFRKIVRKKSVMNPDAMDVDDKPFITKADIELYEDRLDEFKCAPRQRLYCRGTECNAFIPRAARNKAGMGTCYKCFKKTCRKCRRKDHKGKCTRLSKRRQREAETDVLFFQNCRSYKRCPGCRMFTERIKGGCSTVLCICGERFHTG